MRIVSRDSAPFEGRAEAGRLLAAELDLPGEEIPVVLGIPRGGLIVAHSLARSLNAPLDAVFVLKIGLPGNPELAVGAVSEGGEALLNEQFIERMGIRDPVEQERKKQAAELTRRADLIRRLRPRVPLAGRTVIITDDGVATGYTTRAAFRSVRREAPRKIIGAVPVGDEGAIEKLADEADDMVCLRCPPAFLAVSQFYRQYPQVTDEEIVRLFL
jgi:putative phosphoribosyl transferase